MLKRLSYIAVVMLVVWMVPKIALAGPMYLNIHIANSCGNWEIIKYQHCASRGKRKGNGGIAYVVCEGGVNGAGTVSFKSANCGPDTVRMVNGGANDGRRKWQTRTSSRITVTRPWWGVTQEMKDINTMRYDWK